MTNSTAVSSSQRTSAAAVAAAATAAASAVGGRRDASRSRSSNGRTASSRSTGNGNSEEPKKDSKEVAHNDSDVIDMTPRRETEQGDVCTPREGENDRCESVDSDLRKNRNINSKPPRVKGTRARGRGGVQSLHISASSKAPTESKNTDSLVYVQQDKDFCFRRMSSETAESTLKDISSALDAPACNSAAALTLHRLLSPLAAASAIAAGLSISSVCDSSSEDIREGGVVRAVYGQVAEGLFLSHGTQYCTTEELQLDILSLRHSLLLSPLPVLLKKDSASTSLLLPPLSSAYSPYISHSKKQRRGDKVVVEDVLLNVGGPILALAVSDECGYAETEACCRSRDSCSRYSVRTDEGFVVLAVSVGSLHRTGDIRRPPIPPSHRQSNSEPDCNSSSSSSSSSSSGPSVSTKDAGTDTGVWKAKGQLQLWALPNSHSRRPSLRAILQINGGSCRSLSWVPDSRLFLPRCDREICERDGEGVCCGDGRACCRSRVGLLLGVLEEGEICMWSVPLMLFLPDGINASNSGGPPTQTYAEDGLGGGKTENRMHSTCREIDSHLIDESGGRCLVLPAVWRYRASDVRLYCCAASPPYSSSVGVGHSICTESLRVVAGAGEGRLYVFSFMSFDSKDILDPLRLSVYGKRSYLSLEADKSLRCSMCTVTPGCPASEVRCCSFLPADRRNKYAYKCEHKQKYRSSTGSNFLAIALRESASRSGSVLILDLSRALVGASGGSAGCTAASQGQSAMADNAAFQVAEGNCNYRRSRQVHELVWSPLARYLVASAENALLINLRKHAVKQLPLRTLLYPRRGGSRTSAAGNDSERCCWGCTALGLAVFYSFNGGCLVQGDAGALEQAGQGCSRCWQWGCANTEDQKVLSSVLQQQPHLVASQLRASEQLQELRLSLLSLLKEQMNGALSSPQEGPAPTKQHDVVPVEVMQKRINTLMALQQLEEQGEMLTCGLVIAEHSMHDGNRKGFSLAKAPSIMSLQKVVSICPWTNRCYFAKSPRIAYGGAAGIIHVKDIQM